MLHVPQLVFGILLKRKQKSERLQKCPQFMGKFMFPITWKARNTITVVETSLCPSFSPVMKVTEWDFSVWDARIR